MEEAAGGTGGEGCAGTSLRLWAVRAGIGQLGRRVGEWGSGARETGAQTGIKRVTSDLPPIWEAVLELSCSVRLGAWRA